MAGLVRILLNLSIVRNTGLRLQVRPYCTLGPVAKAITASALLVSDEMVMRIVITGQGAGLTWTDSLEHPVAAIKDQSIALLFGNERFGRPLEGSRGEKRKNSGQNPSA